MRKSINTRQTLSWYLDFPGFEKTHWWKQSAWKWINPRVKNPNKRGGVEPNEELKTAIAWETLRRHPHTRNLCNDFKTYDIHKRELTELVKKELNATLPQMIRVWLALYGLQSWASLSEQMRENVRKSLFLPVDLSEAPQGVGVRPCIRGNEVRDLLLEAMRCLLRQETHLDPSTQSIVSKFVPVEIKTESEHNKWYAIVDRELHELISKAREDGYGKSAFTD